MSALGPKTIHGFALHRIENNKCWSMQPSFPEGHFVLIAGSKTCLYRTVSWIADYTTVMHSSHCEAAFSFVNKQLQPLI